MSNSRLLREGVVTLLTPLMNIALVGSYPEELVLAGPLPNPPAHVVLLDGGMEPRRATRWIRYWCCCTPSARVVVFELANDVDAILACVEAGADGYTLQGAAPSELVVAIKHAHLGLASCSPEVTAHIFARLARLGGSSNRKPALLPRLTTRELEVLRHVAADYSNQQIADLLVVDVRTVKHHVHNILQKLKLRHRWDAARFAAEQGWLDDPVDRPPCAPN